MNRLILALLIIVLGTVTSTGKAYAEYMDSEVPFTLEKGQIIVPAKIRGNVSVEVALTTGLEHSLVNGTLLKKYELQLSYTSDGIVTGGNLDRVVHFVQVSDVQVGDLPARNLNMSLGAQTAGEISQKIGREIFAILGADFFKGRIVQFDFGRKVIRLLSRRPANTSLSSDAFATLAMRSSDKPVRLPITEGIVFNGKKIKTLLDVGALTVISLTASAAKEIGLPIPPDKSSPLSSKISLHFEKMSFEDLPVLVHSKGSDLDRGSNGYGAILGIALLQNFIVTFDFDDGVITMERV